MSNTPPMCLHNLCVEQNYEKYQNFLSENFQFLVVKFQYIWIGVFSLCQIQVTSRFLWIFFSLHSYRFCLVLFCSCVFSPFGIAITSLGEERELILVLFLRLFDLRLFGFVCFLFLLVSGMILALPGIFTYILGLSFLFSSFWKG